ncbi:MAG: tetratricopeptide repeat protein, partial [Planctomycetes bacterium]|nr:tetratricopeptide repeat protein [Planctomycetota bacterium]
MSVEDIINNRAYLTGVNNPDQDDYIKNRLADYSIMPPRKKTLLLFAVIAVLSLILPQASAKDEKGVYEKLDQAKLAKTLKEFGMTELLETISKPSPGKKVNIVALSLLVDNKIKQALEAVDQENRDNLLDEAIAYLDRLIVATAKAKDDMTILKHYRFVLKRIVTEGITKADKYAERVSYFLASPDDPKILKRLTASALKRLDQLMDKLINLQELWADDEERMVTGAAWQLEALIDEVRYRGAWIRLYHAMVLPAGSEERSMLLQQAIQDVKKFADAEDNSSGVKFYSLLLSGICSRLLGKWQQAESYLDRAADEQAAPAVRLKALFEKVLCYIDQKKFTEAARAIEQFRKRGVDLGMPKVAVDMQSALLASHLADVQADALEKSDPQAATEFRAKSRKYLLDFLEKYPNYREAFVEVIATKYEGVDTKELFPDMKILLGIRLYNKALRKYESSPQKVIPLDLLTKAEKYFDEVLSDKRAGKKVQATALWYLALIRNLERRNLEAAKYFRQLAEKFPDDERARNAAIYAVRSLRGILAEKNVEPTEMGTTFVKEYAQCLSILVKNWGQTDPEIRSYNYELGMLYDKLGRTSEAIDAFERI